MLRGECISPCGQPAGERWAVQSVLGEHVAEVWQRAIDVSEGQRQQPGCKRLGGRRQSQESGPPLLARCGAAGTQVGRRGSGRGVGRTACGLCTPTCNLERKKTEEMLRGTSNCCLFCTITEVLAHVLGGLIAGHSSRRAAGSRLFGPHIAVLDRDRCPSPQHVTRPPDSASWATTRIFCEAGSIVLPSPVTSMPMNCSLLTLMLHLEPCCCRRPRRTLRAPSQSPQP